MFRFSSRDDQRSTPGHESSTTSEDLSLHASVELSINRLIRDCPSDASSTSDHIRSLWDADVGTKEAQQQQQLRQLPRPLKGPIVDDPYLSNSNTHKIQEASIIDSVYKTPFMFGKHWPDSTPTIDKVCTVQELEASMRSDVREKRQLFNSNKFSSLYSSPQGSAPAELNRVSALQNGHVDSHGRSVNQNRLSADRSSLWSANDVDNSVTNKSNGVSPPPGFKSSVGVLSGMDSLRQLKLDDGNSRVLQRSANKPLYMRSGRDSGNFVRESSTSPFGSLGSFDSSSNGFFGESIWSAAGLGDCDGDPANKTYAAALRSVPEMPDDKI